MIKKAMTESLHGSPEALQLRDQLLIRQRRSLTTAYPIYGRSRSRVRLLGSGFLLLVETTPLLVTAAHVLRERRDFTLVLPHFETELPPLQIFETDVGTVDLAIAVLPEGVLPDRARVRPVSVSDLDFSVAHDPEAVYCVTGFPLTKNKQKPAMKFRPRALAYTAGNADSSVYTALHRDAGAFLALRFSRHHALDRDLRSVNTLDPTGVSGGPVWRLGRVPELLHGAGAEKVVAIAIELHRPLGAILAVRVSILGDLIRHYLPELAAGLPGRHSNELGP